MRPLRHITPRYVRDRLIEMAHHRLRPDFPWLTNEANNILSTYLRDTDTGLEFGSGRSTVWFASHVGKLTSVEHNAEWYDRVKTMLADAGRTNVEYLLIPMDKDESDGADAAYVRATDRFAANSLDFALVDGMYRDFCALAVLDKLRPGGVLVIDNVNWYLPFRSHSPNSRTPEQGPKTVHWKEFLDRTKTWRRIWTSSGVTDTAFFFKPCG